MGTAIGIGIGVAFSTGSWWLSGASMHADFAANRLFGASDFATAFPITRATAGYADDSGGNWTSFGTGVLRRTDKGLKIEEARTNLFLNSLAPVTQTITVSNATVYTVSLWATGGTLTLSGAGSGTVNANGSITFTSSSTSLTVTCNSLSGAFQCVNVEAGAFKTSPISTAGASAARNGDAVTLANALNYISLAASGLFVEWDELVGPSGASRRLFDIRVDASNIIVANILSTGTIQFLLNRAGVGQCNLASTNAVAAGNRYKAAVRWAANDMALQVTSSLISPAKDTSGTMITGTPTVGVGQVAGSGYLNSNLRQFATFLTPPSDSQLASMVA